MLSFLSVFSTKVSSVALLSLNRYFHMSPTVLSVVKTKQAAAKRMIRTGKGNNCDISSVFWLQITYFLYGSGGIKVGHANKSHLNGGKSRKQIRRLNSKVGSADFVVTFQF